MSAHPGDGLRVNLADGLRLGGRVAIVTGASRGIGRETARYLAAAGADVALVARSEAALKELAAEIEAGGRRALVLPAELGGGGAEMAKQIVEATVEALGGLSILVNNAGITRDNLLLRMRAEEWDQVLAVDLTAAFQLSQAALRPMLKARYGRIINVTSVVGLTGNAGQANYAAAKAGLIGFTKSLAKEVGSRAITVNAVAPGFVETEMTRALANEAREKLLSLVPMARAGSPRDVAEAILFLASDAAGYVTGEVLRVDGGMAM